MKWYNKHLRIHYKIQNLQNEINGMDIETVVISDTKKVNRGLVQLEN